MTTNSEWVRYGTIARLSLGTVLDWGCGSGEMTTAIAVFGHKIYGIDGSEKNIQSARLRAKELRLDCRFLKWEKDKLPLPDASFDTIVLNLKDHYMYTDIDFERLKEAMRLCASGGRVVVPIVLNGKKKIHKSSIKKKIEKIGFSFIDWIERKEKKYDWCVGYAEHNKLINKSQICPEIKDIFLEPLPLEPLDTSEKVSVIIPTYNRAQFLPHCLNSVLNQTYPNIEIIVINDGSTDATDEVLKPYLEKIKYTKKENGGKSTALNAGLKEATGKYVWIFDDDDLALPKKLEMDIRLFQKKPDIDIVHSYGYRLDNATGDILSMYMCEVKKPDKIMHGLFIWPQILNITMVVKKKCYDHVGSFREDFVRCQDYQMWFRLARDFKMHLLEYGTVFARIHTGIRGNEKEHFYTPEDCNKYEKKLFTEIYADFPLKDFNPTLMQNPGDPYKQAVALLERAKIMSIHGLNDLAKHDLQKIVEITRESGIKLDVPFIDRVINYWQQTILKKNYNFGLSILKCLKELSNKNRNGLFVSNYTAKRFFWSFEKNIRLFNWKQSIQRFMIGLHFFLIMIRQKIYEKVSLNADS